MTKQKAKKVRIPTCIICNDPLTEHSLIFSYENENDKYRYPDGKLRKIIGRCQGCEPGSLPWMESEIGKDSPNRIYFLTLYKDNPLFRKEFQEYVDSKKEVFDLGEISRAPAMAKKSKKSEKLAIMKETNPLVDQFLREKDPKKKAKLRRQLRKKGIYISQLSKHR